MGALGLTPDPATQPSTPAMTYAAPQGGPPLGSPGGLQLPGSPGYNPLAGALSVLQSLQPSNSSPQGDAFRAKQYDTATSLIGDPSEVTGALSRVRSSRDSKTAGQMASIQRAMQVLGGLDDNSGRLQQLAIGSGFLQSAAPGTADRSFGDASSALAAEIERQRTFQRQNALDLSSLGTTAAGIPEQAAEADLGDLYARMHEGEAIGSNAAMGDYRQGQLAARNLATGAQLAGRITAADLSSHKNEFSYLGTNPQDPTQGIYLDKTTGQQYAGPPVSKPGGSGGGASEWKYTAWLAAHPGDQAGALDFVAGHRKMDEADARKFAESQARAELGPGADPADIDKRAETVFGNITGGFGGAPSPAHQPPPATPPAQPQMAHPLTQADFDKLPKGAHFINPADGKPYVKQ